MTCTLYCRRCLEPVCAEDVCVNWALDGRGYLCVKCAIPFFEEIGPERAEALRRSILIEAANERLRHLSADHPKRRELEEQMRERGWVTPDTPPEQERSSNASG